MDSLKGFLQSLIPEQTIVSNKLTVEEARLVVSKMNEYFFTNYEGIGTTNILDNDYEFISEFHKFWERNHKEILNPSIDLSRCEAIADILHDIYIKYDKKPFYNIYDTCGLTSQEICRIRYFSSNQDFRGSRSFSELAEIYRVDPSIFDTEKIYEKPVDFIKDIGISGLSQNDKRIHFASNAAKLLIDNKIEPYDLLSFCTNDIAQVRQLLVSNKGAGYGNKKADMFLRDMVVLKVWNNVTNFDVIDVASDVNTIKVALRCGILKTDIVLISSFLDIFSYQYSLIDTMNAKAWREVWNAWQRKYPTECIESPSLMDYLVYRIVGREFCKESLYTFRCETGAHTFKWHSAKNRTCQICHKQGQRHKAEVVKKTLPCADNEGHIFFEKNINVNTDNAVLAGMKTCPFVCVCCPSNNRFKKYNPPKSISILGRTGWDSAKARRDEGGGGLMS